MNHASRVKDLLGLRQPPIAIGFFDSPPSGVERWEGGEAPAGCALWKKAMEGRIFYTVPSDHYNCAVGCHTHGIALPSERSKELEDTVGFMVSSKYIAMEEVASIPTLGKAPGVVAYGPVDQVGFEPDAVLIAATPAQAMLIYEAALKAGAGDALTHALGRPGCAVLPLTIQSGASTLSFGCKGNRTFTGLPDDEMYVCVPGEKWAAVAGKVAEVCEANATMEQYYAGQKARFERV
ncbi:MAG: hypothetical protein EXS64_18280 [Candidatus Latescibacteria bacterium]|nr:hypothetical protein [Candidatus Latescibacterota bacterium]